MAVIDTFTFFGGDGVEFDMLECRLTELDSVVDWFIAVEGNLTYQGDPKLFHLTEFLASSDRFDAWRDRLVVVQAKDLPTKEETHDPWDREHASREALVNGLDRVDCRDDDVVLHGDLDEIPKPVVVRNLRPRGFVVCEMPMYSMAVDWLHPDPWRGTVAARAKSIRTFTDMRDIRNFAPHLPDAGWHLSWLGGQAAQKSKLAAFSHPEIAPDVEGPIEEDLFYREGWHVDGVKLTGVEVDASWPKWVSERRCPTSWFRPR